nr:uncharacterized protein LOC117274394 [Nicotiana tomentosiformis]
MVGHGCYCFLDGYSGYNKIPIASEDVEKTVFTCPSGIFAYRRMSFGLCNAPATFQRWIMSIFSDLNGKCQEVFMDNFTLFGDDFEDCLKNLELVLEHCEATHLVLNWEKCHFMVKEGIVLGHKVTAQGIKVDRDKVDVIARLSPPTSMKSMQSFLGHAEFYRRFIKNFSSITKPLTALLAKDVKFVFNVECLRVFELIKEKLVSAPIMVTPDWNQPFEIMCDTSDVAVGAIFCIIAVSERPPWYADVDNFLASGWLPHDLSLDQRRKLQDGVIRRCVPEREMASILSHFHDGAAGGHYDRNHTATKVIEADFFWPTLYKDARAYVAACDKYQRVGNISKREKCLSTPFCASRKDWSVKLEEALWAYKTAFKTIIGTLPFKLAYKQLCHLPVKIEHKAYWAIKRLNLDFSLAGEHRLAQMNALEEFRLDAYENARIFKEKSKRWHDHLIKTNEFHEGDKVLLYNGRLRLFPGKFKSRWTGPYMVKHVSPYGVTEIQNQDGTESFIVNGHKLKPYLVGGFAQQSSSIKIS